MERFLRETWTLPKGADRAAIEKRLREELFPASLAPGFVYCVNSRELDVDGM